MNEPIVSFIIPVYNTAKYINKCVDSVIRQTYPDWEAILIDDGSTDGSGEKCDEFARSDSRISVIHKANSGQFDSRMSGIRIAKGKYCTGLDSDDYIDENFVKIIHTTLENNPSDIVCWNIREVSETEEELTAGSMIHYGVYSNTEFLENIRKTTNHSFCNKLIRTDLLINSYYGDVPRNARHSEDLILICPSICMADRIFAIDKVLYNYRQIQDSVTHAYSSKRILDYLDSEECIQKIIKHYSLDTPKVEKAGYMALVREIGYCMKQGYKSSGMNPEDSMNIRTHEIYRDLKKYETRNNLTYDQLVVMKLFRHRLEGILGLMYGKFGSRKQN